MASYYLLMLVLPATILVYPNCVYSLKYCQKGSYEVPLNNDRPVCLLCPVGTFMPYHDHRYKQCFKCTKIVDPLLEVLISPCTDTQDAVIHCIPGYYRRLGRNPREKATCEKCTECDYPIVPCQIYEDTHCCQGDHFIVYPDGNGVPLCWETYWLCRRGQYLDIDSYLCKPCPTGTFMSLDYHSMTECWPCHTPSERHHLPKHADIIQECNSTHPPIIDCADGFYTDHDLGYYENRIGCSPCTVCNPADGMYEIRACDRFQDTICCPQPDMIVVDTPTGMRCEADNTSLLVTETDPDYYQTIETSTTSSISAFITTKDTHENLNGLHGECRCESFSCHTVIEVTVAATILAVIFLGIMSFLFRQLLLFIIMRSLFNLSLHAVRNVDEYKSGESDPLLLCSKEGSHAADFGDTADDDTNEDDDLKTVDSAHTKMLMEYNSVHFKLQEADSGSAVGAALAAAVSVRLNNTTSQ